MKNKYLKLLKSANENVDIISYCIMNNHVHLLVSTENKKCLYLFLKDINNKYESFYNYLYKKRKINFKLKFIEIENKEQLIKCIKYIHENPVKAGVVKEKQNYKFSSYKEFITNKFYIENQKLKSEKKDSISEYLNIYLNQNNLTLFLIRKNPEEIKKFIKYLEKQNVVYYKTQVAKTLNLPINKLLRIIKND